MSIIICEKRAQKPYRIKEIDINIWTIEELCFYIYNYTVLISSDFICPKLLFFLYNELGLKKLSNRLKIMKEKNDSMNNLLMSILDYSFLYSTEELLKFKKNLNTISSMEINAQIELAGDLLFKLNKFEKTIKLYEQLEDSVVSKYKKICFCYAKSQDYDKAIQIAQKGINILDKIESDDIVGISKAKIDLLKNLYFVCRLNNSKEIFNKYSSRVDDLTITDWDIEYIQTNISVKDEKNIKSLDEMFLMDDIFIQSNVESIIKRWKETYRELI
ncbi:MAG: hypothetical protein Q4F88_02840 [Eubacteriales bacterium]|nr:hypothetical protein [Eubacteriales bacterium]